MTTTAQFAKSLRVGHKGEEIVRVALVAAGCEAYTLNTSEARDLQARVQGNWFWVEVKNEVGYADAPKNLCIETHQAVTPQNPFGRWSGINASEAQVFVHLFGEKVALYRKQAMRVWLRQLQDGGLKRREIGDYGTMGFIVPIISLFPMPWFDWCDLGAVAESKVWRVG